MNLYSCLFILTCLIYTINCVSRKPDEGPSNRYSSKNSGPPSSPENSSSGSPSHRDRVRSPRSRERSPHYSDYPATDSNDSFTGKETAPGTEAYHKEMHHLYNRKTSFHNEVFKGSIKREREFAYEHKAEMESSHRRHQIHGRIKRKIASGRLLPGPRTALPKPISKEPNSRRVDNLRRSDKVVWNEKKGFYRLLPKLLPKGQKRKKRPSEPNTPNYSSASTFDTPSPPSSSTSHSNPSPRPPSPKSPHGGVAELSR
jgi:hypothetical protein